jgi:hypothetical protein
MTASMSLTQLSEIQANNSMPLVSHDQQPESVEGMLFHGSMIQSVGVVVIFPMQGASRGELTHDLNIAMSRAD